MEMTKEWFTLKRLLAASIAVGMMVGTGLLNGAPAAASSVPQQPVTVIIDGEVLHTSPSPVIQNGRILLPMRATLASLGATVSWDAATRTASAGNVQHTVQVTADSRYAWSDGVRFRLDVPAQIMEDRIFLPLRFTSEALGASVTWDAQTRTATILRGRESDFTSDEMKESASYLTPYVTSDGYKHFHFLPPADLWLTISPSALRQLRASLDSINTLVDDLPPEMIGDEEGMRAQGIETMGYNPFRSVRVKWWLTKWYVDAETAYEIRSQINRHADYESLGSLILSRYPVTVALSRGLAAVSLLLGYESRKLDDCMRNADGRGIIIYVIYPRLYGWCEAG